MFDNFNLIPGEAFKALDNISNNLINKVAAATGYMFIPHGRRKDKEEAIDYLIDEIKNNDKMPLYLKAASISNARRLLKKYSNQQDILYESMKYLDDNARPESLDDDWLVNFMEKAGNISNKDIQSIYAKILAEEASKPGMISRNLINTIAVMDHELADAFRRLSKAIVYLQGDNGEEPEIVLPIHEEKGKYHQIISFMDLVNLTSIGLVEYAVSFGSAYIWDVKEATVRYGDERFILRSQNNKIPIGDVNLTRSGIELSKIIVSEVDATYLSQIKEFWRERGIEIINQ